MRACAGMSQISPHAGSDGPSADPPGAPRRGRPRCGARRQRRACRRWRADPIRAQPASSRASTMASVAPRSEANRRSTPSRSRSGSPDHGPGSVQSNAVRRSWRGRAAEPGARRSRPRRGDGRPPRYVHSPGGMGREVAARAAAATRSGKAPSAASRSSRRCGSLIGDSSVSSLARRQRSVTSTALNRYRWKPVMSADGSAIVGAIPSSSASGR